MTTPLSVAAYRVVLGLTLKMLREAEKLSQAAVAEALGRTQSWYSKAERGEATISLCQARLLRGVLTRESRGEDFKEWLLPHVANELCETLKKRGVTVLEPGEPWPSVDHVALDTKALEAFLLQKKEPTDA